MKEEKYYRLRHWWRAFQQELQSNDETSLRRKLYLLEAEIRKTLREDYAPPKRRGLHPALSFGVTLGALLLALGLLYLPRFYAPNDQRSAPSFQAMLPEPAVSAKGTTALPSAGVMEIADSGAVKKVTRVRAKRSSGKARRSVATTTPPVAPPPPAAAVESPPSAPASVGPPPAESPAVSPSLNLDALELLVALEGELEK